MTIKERISEWLLPPFDEETQIAVKDLKKNPQELEDAFYTYLKFGTGGIRGIMGVGVNRINKYTLGKSTQGLCHFLKKKYSNESIKVVVAYDCRNQSKNFAGIVSDIFTANEINCYLFTELRPTPELSFAIRRLKAHCGIVITASHNPPEYNGYKVYGNDGGQIVPPDDEIIIKEIESTNFNEIRFKGNSKYLKFIDKEIDKEYQKVVLSLTKISSGDPAKLIISFTPIHGTSITLLPQILEIGGYNNVYVVKEQEFPDGDFSTVLSPNPEDPKALKMAVDLAEKKKADIVIGTDPDADRLGIVVRDLDQNWYYLNGNQIMVVLTEYLLSKKKSINQLNSNHFIASTIVSTPMIKVIAEAYEVEYKSCLTGFKWIAKLIKDHPKLNFVGGGEESFGYLVGDLVRDKDAISATLLVCELASELKSNGKSIYHFLLECYKKYGVYYERLKSIKMQGKEGAFEIRELMKKFRYMTPRDIGGIPIHNVEDYLSSTSIDFEKNKKEKINLPKADLLIFTLEDQTRIALRPSGTEPKIKFYFSVTSNYELGKCWHDQQKKLDQKIDLFIKDLLK